MADTQRLDVSAGIGDIGDLVNLKLSAPATCGTVHVQRGSIGNHHIETTARNISVFSCGMVAVAANMNMFSVRQYTLSIETRQSPVTG